MAKDTDYTNNVDDMPYDEYIAQQKTAMEEDSKSQEKSGGDKPSSYNVDQEDGYQPDTFSDEGGYDDYLSGGGVTSSGNKNKSKQQDAEDGAMTGKTKSSENPMSDGEGGGVNVLAGGKGSGTEMQSATTGQAAAGVGSKIVEGIKGAGANVLNGFKKMFMNMGGAIGQLANTLHVSAKAMYVTMAIMSGTGVTFFGITFFGGDNMGRFEPQRDCRVDAVMNFEYTNNDVFTPMTQSAMDGNAKSIYKALSSKDLIDGIIGFEYTVGDAGTDPYYDDRTRYYVEPDDTENPQYWKYLGVLEVEGKTDLDGNPVFHKTWMFDVNMGKKMWSHGPATLLDTSTGGLNGTLNVIPGNGARVTGEDPDVSNRIGAGTLPGLTDQRIQLHKGFTDEAILGMILNAEQESKVDPGCWEANYLCFYYIGAEGVHNTARNIVLATTHHRNWNTYVLELNNIHSINLNAYHYTDVNGHETEMDGQKLYYPGIGLWQWTGPRAYAMEQWNNMLMNVKDGTLDTANDALYSMNSQIYYVLFENLGNWKGDLVFPDDHGGQRRYAIDYAGNRIVDNNADPATDPLARVSLIDWGVTKRVTYKEAYYVNIPDRPNTETLYGRDRTKVHEFSSVRTLNQADDSVEDNHDNLVRPQFDYVYTTTTGGSITYGEIEITDSTGDNVRKLNLQKVAELYDLMITHPDRPACECCKCICDSHDTAWGKREAEGKHDNEDCAEAHAGDATEEEEEEEEDGEEGEEEEDEPSVAHVCHTDEHNGVISGNMDSCAYGGDCSPDPCYHQCSLDTITNAREMVSALMKTYKNKDGYIWWEGLTEADFLDSGSRHTSTYSCGDKLYNNLKGGIASHTPSAHKPEYLDANHNMSCYYVKWYYDVSVEVTAYQGGHIMHDVDNMSDTFGGGNGDTNGNAARPDNASYTASGVTMADETGDWIQYESTPEAVCGYVAGEEVYEDSASSHPGTNTDTDGYSQQSHASSQGGWMRGAADSTNWAVHFYMNRTIGDADSTQWANYGQYPVAWSGNVAPVDARLNYDSDWIGWNNEVFEEWYGATDTQLGVHKGKVAYAPSSGNEIIDRYYRLRLAGYDGVIISPATGSAVEFGENDGNLVHGSGPKATWSGTGPNAYPLHPVEPTIADLGASGGGGVIGGVTEWGSGAAMAGGDDYVFVRTISDNLMWWAEARAIGQASRISAREYTDVWEGNDSAVFLNNHSKFGSAVHYAFKMLSDTWGSDNKGSDSILDMWYENMSTAPVQTWWRSFYRNYCNDGSVAFGGIAECAVSWAWLQGHDDTATVHDTGPRLDGGQYKKTRCTELYVGVKDLMETIPTTEPTPGLYSSCDRGVCTAVHASGADDGFPWGAAVGQYDYAMASGKWEDLGPVTASSFDSLEPGDLLLSPHHVIVFVGGEYAAKKWPSEVSESDGKYGVVHSSLSSSIQHSRGPRYDPDGRTCVSSGDFRAFRLSGEPDSNSACRAALEAAESTLSGLDDGSF